MDDCSVIEKIIIHKLLYFVDCPTFNKLKLFNISVWQAWAAFTKAELHAESMSMIV
jgi:hypothetical protein